MTNSLIKNQKNYHLRNLHSYIKNDDLDALINLLNKKPSLLTFKNFKNENILFYSLLSNSHKISSYLMIYKPKLLLERNNLGRNAAQNLASKKIDLSLLFKGLSLLNHPDTYQVFSNVDNLGNNLLMYLSLYEDIHYYNKATSICPNIKTLQNFQNKKKSNVLHFLASNANYKGEIELTKYHNNLFSQNTINNTTVAMFAAENQPINRFQLYLNEYKSDLSEKNISEKLDFKNSLGFNVLDFAFLNKNHENAKYLLENYGNIFSKDIKDGNLITLLKNSIKNNNIEIFEMIFNHYELNEKEKELIIFPIIQLALQNNDKNPFFLDYIIDKKIDLVTDSFINPKNYEHNIYINNIEKINDIQWDKILNKISLSKNKISYENINNIFFYMTYNPKFLDRNLQLFSSFFTSRFDENKSTKYIAKKLLYLPEKNVKSFVEKNNFLNKCKGLDIDTLIFLIQELNEIKPSIPKKELKLSLIIEDNITSQTKFEHIINKNIYNKNITHMNKIIQSYELFSAFSQIIHSEQHIIKHIIKEENIFDSYLKISNYISDEEKKYIFGLLFYEITYMPTNSIKYCEKEWSKFKEIYTKHINVLSPVINNNEENENLEALENLIDILKAHIVPSTTIEYQLDFLKFISDKFAPISPRLIDKKVFIQDIGTIILDNILNKPIEKRKNLINNLISINENFIKRDIPIHIPSQFLNLIDNKDRNSYINKINFFLRKSNNIISDIKNLYNKIEIDEVNLEEIVELLIDKVKSSDINLNSSEEYEMYKQFSFSNPSLLKNKLPIFKFRENNPTRIDKDVFNNILSKYLKSNSVDKLNILNKIYLEENYFTVENIHINKVCETKVNVQNLDNINYLNIYNYHCPEKLLQHKDVILEHINSKEYHSLNLQDKIIILYISDNLNILEDLVCFKSIIEDYSKIPNELYKKLIEDLILKNYDSKIFNNIEFNKIINLDLRLMLENSYLERNVPKNKTKTKVMKY